MMYNSSSFRKDITSIFENVKSSTGLTEGITSIINDWMSTTNNKRIRVITVKMKFGKRLFDFTFNRTDGVNYILKSLITLILDKYNVEKRYIPYFDNRKSVESSYDLTLRYLKNIDNIIKNDSYYEVCLSNSFLKELEEESQKVNDFIEKYLRKYIDKYHEVLEHEKTIEMDENASLYHPSNIEKVLESASEYLDFLEDHYDELDLDNSKERFNVQTSNGTFYIPFEGRFDKAQVLNQLRYRIGNDSAVIDIVPKIIVNDNLKEGLYFNLRFIYDDKFIACKKHLNYCWDRGVAEYYASKKSGDYTGD